MKNNYKKNIVVWIDVDEVLVDFREYFHNYINSVYGFNIKKGFIPKDWHYSEFFKDRTEFNRIMEDMPRDWPKKLNILPGAKEFISELKKRKAHIVLITHIPGDLAPERIINLNNHGLYFDEIYLTYKRKKSEFAAALINRYQQKEAKVHHLFIDDKAENGYEFLKDCKELDYFVTLSDEYNLDAVSKMKREISKKRFDFNSKNNEEMYLKIIKKIDSILNKK